MAIMTHAKFHFNWLMLTSIFCIWASEPPRAWRMTEKAGPDRVKLKKLRDWFHFGGTKLSFPVLRSVYFVTGIHKHSLNFDLRDHHLILYSPLC